MAPGQDPHAEMTHLRSKDEWRRWLETNHARCSDVWLVIRKKAATLAAPTYDQALEEALCFGWIDGKMRSIDESTFVLRFSPRKPGSLWSQLNRQRAEELIRLGRMAPAGLLKIAEAQANGRWASAYTSRAPPQIPSDVQAALAAHPAAWANFSRFNNSSQTMYIFWVQQAKRPQTRAKRIYELVRRSALNLRPGSRLPPD